LPVCASSAYFKGLDLNLLAALDVLLDEKNTTRAGERLCLSQSAMSGALARLREYFNDELLMQAGRGFVLTPLAESLIEPVGALLRQIEAAIASKARFDPATSAVVGNRDQSRRHDAPAAGETGGDLAAVAVAAGADRAAADD
jgi:DNA-binding transcriptional LysR family regulator